MAEVVGFELVDAAMLRARRLLRGGASADGFRDVALYTLDDYGYRDAWEELVLVRNRTRREGTPLFLDLTAIRREVSPNRVKTLNTIFREVPFVAVVTEREGSRFGDDFDYANAVERNKLPVCRFDNSGHCNLTNLDKLGSDAQATQVGSIVDGISSPSELHVRWTESWLTQLLKDRGCIAGQAVIDRLGIEMSRTVSLRPCFSERDSTFSIAYELAYVTTDGFNDPALDSLAGYISTGGDELAIAGLLSLMTGKPVFSASPNPMLQPEPRPEPRENDPSGALTLLRGVTHHAGELDRDVAAIRSRMIHVERACSIVDLELGQAQLLDRRRMQRLCGLSNSGVEFNATMRHPTEAKGDA
ncbi:MAG: hypothetical protein JXA57_14555 [Armatimonadetes bacterium]|nr:hypothetical protein [Armatimonadota bacterium]